MILTSEQIQFILERLRWTPVYEDATIVVAKKRAGGYSEDRKVGAIEAALSIALEVNARHPGRY